MLALRHGVADRISYDRGRKADRVERELGSDEYPSGQSVLVSLAVRVCNENTSCTHLAQDLLLIEMSKSRRNGNGASGLVRRHGVVLLGIVDVLDLLHVRLVGGARIHCAGFRGER